MDTSFPNCHDTFNNQHDKTWPDLRSTVSDKTEKKQRNITLQKGHHRYNFPVTLGCFLQILLTSLVVKMISC